MRNPMALNMLRLGGPQSRQGRGRFIEHAEDRPAADLFENTVCHRQVSLGTLAERMGALRQAPGYDAP